MRTPFAFRLYARNHRMSVFGNPGHQPSPVELLAHRFGVVDCQTRLGDE